MPLAGPPPAAVVAHLDHVVGAAAGAGRAGRVVQRTLHREPVVLVARDVALSRLVVLAPGAVVRGPGGVLTVRRTIVVLRGHRLRVAAPAAREVRLLSTGGRRAMLVGLGAHLEFRGPGLRVRSWDPARAGPDLRLDDGRAAVSVRGRGRLDAYDTTFDHLGFSEGRWSGFALNQRHGAPRPTGRVYRSRFEANLFGAYTYAAVGMRWIGNRFDDNLVYGLDPHDDSDGFVVRRNRATGNGRHGIIFSRLCDRNVITDNLVTGNGWHGIVLDDGRRGDGPSTRNVVARNRVAGNRLVGISVDGSPANAVRDNVVSGGRDGIRVFGPSTGVAVTGNTVRDPADSGVLVDGPARGVGIRANAISGARTGVRLRAAAGVRVLANDISGARAHAVLVTGAAGRSAGSARVAGNVLQGSGPSPIAVGGPGAGAVRSGANRERWDYPAIHDAATVLHRVGVGAWLLLLVLAAAAPAATVRVRRLLQRSDVVR